MRFPRPATSGGSGTSPPDEGDWQLLCSRLLEPQRPERSNGSEWEQERDAPFREGEPSAEDLRGADPPAEFHTLETPFVPPPLVPPGYCTQAGKLIIRSRVHALPRPTIADCAGSAVEELLVRRVFGPE